MPSSSTLFISPYSALKWDVPGLIPAGPGILSRPSYSDPYPEQLYPSLPKLHTSLSVPPQVYQPRRIPITSSNPFRLQLDVPRYAYTRESNIPASLSVYETEKFRNVIKHCPHPLTYVIAFPDSLIPDTLRNRYDTYGCAPGGPLRVGSWIYGTQWDGPVQITRVLEIDRLQKKLTLEIVSGHDYGMIDQLRIDACFYDVSQSEWRIYCIQQYCLGRRLVRFGLAVGAYGRVGRIRIEEMWKKWFWRE